MNLAEHLDRAALLHGRRPAVRDDVAALDYRGLAEASARAAGRLAHAGVGVGDRVALVLPHGIGFAAWYYAVLRLGAVVAALDPAAPAHVRRRQVREVDARVVVTAGGSAEEPAHLDAAIPHQAAPVPVPPPVRRSDDDLAVIVYTSGTTAVPKAAALTHGNLVHDALQVAQHVLELTEEDVVLGLLPFHGAFGQTCVLNAALLSGASVRIAPRDDLARAVGVLLDDAATVLVGVPSLYLSLLAALDATDRTGGSGGRVRLCLCGGAPLPLGLLLDLERRLGCVVLEGYGLSEAAPVVSANRIDHRRLGSVGLPLDGVEVRVLPTEEDAVGELLVRGRTVMAGYWGPAGVRSEALVDGWLHTGDIGRLDADGYLHVLDRADEVIWRGGRAVYPREIEEVLYDHPAVREAAVVEVPRPDRADPDGGVGDAGAELVAFVTLDPAHVDDDEVLRGLEREIARLPAHARPVRVQVRPDMPRTRTGKILKRALRTAVEA